MSMPSSAAQRLDTAQAVVVGLLVHATRARDAVRDAFDGQGDELGPALSWAGNDLERVIEDVERVRLLVRAPMPQWGVPVTDDIPVELVREVSKALGETGAPWEYACPEDMCEHATCAALAALRPFIVGAGWRA